MNIPHYVSFCIKKLENAGYSAFLVGGAVRDMIMGRRVHDYDITTNAKPCEIISALDGILTVPTGIDHGTVTAVIKGKPIEITTYRIDGDYKDHRRPVGVIFTDKLELDLCRRDFTVNAMAYSEKSGIVDLFGGRNDIKKGIIRAVGEPSLRFEEDALRILRAYRFSSKLGFEIEKKTLLAVKEKAHLLKNIARERILSELNGIFDGKYFYISVKSMIDNRIFVEMFGEEVFLDAEKEKTLKKIKKESKNLVFALLFGENIREITTSLKMSNAQKDEISRLHKIVNSDFFEKEKTDYELRLFLSKNVDLLPEIKKYVRAKYGKSGIFERLENEVTKKPCLSLKELKIDGKDLLNLGFKPVEVGNILDFLLLKVLENPDLNDKEKLVELVKKR